MSRVPKLQLVSIKLTPINTRIRVSSLNLKSRPDDDDNEHVRQMMQMSDDVNDELDAREDELAESDDAEAQNDDEEDEIDDDEDRRDSKAEAQNGRKA